MAQKRYLMTGWAPASRAREKRQVLSAANGALRGWGASLDILWLVGDHSVKERRWILSCGSCDPARVEALEAALTGLHALLYVPLGDDGIRLLPLAASSFSRGKRLSLKKAAARIRSAVEAMGLSAESWLRRALLIPAAASVDIWAHLPPPNAEKQLRSLGFLASSRAVVYLDPLHVADLLAVAQVTPPTREELPRLEAAFQDAYKAIEAIVGDPSSDPRRFTLQLSAAGLSPTSQVGVFTKRELSEAIRALNDTRDRLVAHGSSPRRNAIDLRDVIDAQGCAEFILVHSLRHAKEATTTMPNGQMYRTAPRKSARRR